MYLGIPIVMNIPEERSFLFSSAVMAIVMVILIYLMIGSVILWNLGAAPVFTDETRTTKIAITNLLTPFKLEWNHERAQRSTGTSTYNYKVVRQFALTTVAWGIVGMLATFTF
jgi:hypothetical protein